MSEVCLFCLATVKYLQEPATLPESLSWGLPKLPQVTQACGSASEHLSNSQQQSALLGHSRVQQCLDAGKCSTPATTAFQTELHLLSKVRCFHDVCSYIRALQRSARAGITPSRASPGISLFRNYFPTSGAWLGMLTLSLEERGPHRPALLEHLSIRPSQHGTPHLQTAGYTPVTDFGEQNLPVLSMHAPPWHKQARPELLMSVQRLDKHWHTEESPVLVITG